MTTVLEVEHVSKAYPGGVTALDDVSLRIAEGELLAIVGPSGSGKSTLLNIMGTLDRPSSGQVLLDGKELSQLDDIQLAAVRNREIGFIFQSHHLLPQCTVLENVLVPTLAVLLLLGTPFLHVRFNAPDARILPETAPSRDDPHPKLAPAMRMLAPCAAGRLSSNSGFAVLPSAR